ncbi:MAG: hypothetical protein Q9227_006705 [Pyrenula ochraceoflavens]
MTEVFSCDESLMRKLIEWRVWNFYYDDLDAVGVRRCSSSLKEGKQLQSPMPGSHSSNTYDSAVSLRPDRSFLYKQIHPILSDQDSIHWSIIAEKLEEELAVLRREKTRSLARLFSFGFKKGPVIKIISALSSWSCIPPCQIYAAIFALGSVCDVGSSGSRDHNAGNVIFSPPLQIHILEGDKGSERLGRLILEDLQCLRKGTIFGPKVKHSPSSSLTEQQQRELLQQKALRRAVEHAQGAFFRRLKYDLLGKMVCQLNSFGETLRGDVTLREQTERMNNRRNSFRHVSTSGSMSSGKSGASLNRSQKQSTSSSNRSSVNGRSCSIPSPVCSLRKTSAPPTTDTEGDSQQMSLNLQHSISQRDSRKLPLQRFSERSQSISLPVSSFVAHHATGGLPQYKHYSPLEKVGGVNHWADLPNRASDFHLTGKEYKSQPSTKPSSTQPFPRGGLEESQIECTFSSTDDKHLRDQLEKISSLTGPRVMTNGQWPRDRSSTLLSKRTGSSSQSKTSHISATRKNSAQSRKESVAFERRESRSSGNQGSSSKESMLARSRTLSFAENQPDILSRYPTAASITRQSVGGPSQENRKGSMARSSVFSLNSLDGGPDGTVDKRKDISEGRWYMRYSNAAEDTGASEIWKRKGMRP